MKAVTASQAEQASAPRSTPSPQAAEAVAGPVVETQAEAPAWTPRVVAPNTAKVAPSTATVAPSTAKPAPLADPDSDLSDLMAENMMLKAKLKVEFERYGSLQAILADELRGLRGHVESEMRALDEVCAERDQLKALTANAVREMRDMRAKMDADAEQLAQVRSERDLWMARAETLAQPLFQRR